ncbi:OLC1v1021432C1 [Oldenlandia corymbosa var. corymbosa]|uniref:OLC1v1021432C1 n=1 Tax=Oldenlandia corymbosa var. corymbosa TaxID=529605 RepID=A0AAV1BXX6_OLDCO|nr:OLC1v1021432C1 [Oldenlandia corymbosa var. corymbosa]
MDHKPEPFDMGTWKTEEPVKDIEWKSIGRSSEQSGEEVVKKRLPRKIRQIPDSYFLPRRSLPSAVAFYGAWIVAGVGAGMLAEIWINKKIKVDVNGLRSDCYLELSIVKARRMEVLFGNLTNEKDGLGGIALQFIIL